MRKINELEKSLKESLDNFSAESQSALTAFDLHRRGENLTEYDMDEMARRTFYLMTDFKEHIIKYLKDNQK